MVETVNHIEECLKRLKCVQIYFSMYTKPAQCATVMAIPHFVFFSYPENRDVLFFCNFFARVFAATNTRELRANYIRVTSESCTRCARKPS